MWRGGSLLVVLLGACNAAFEIEQTKLREEEVPDGDLDGVADVDDNCPELANPATPSGEQADEDEDGFGDLCDNCPLLENIQQVDADGDKVGDVCDPHPLNGRDCLVVFDSFADADAFPANWQIEANPPARVVARAGSVEIEDFTGFGTLVTARGVSGDLDILAVGDMPPDRPTSRVELVTNVVDVNKLYGCGVDMAAPPKVLVSWPPSTNTSTVLTAPPITGHLVGRMVTHDVIDELLLRCRVDYGVALGTKIVVGQTILNPQPAGRAGLKITNASVQLFGIALTRYDSSGAPCPPPVLR